MNQSKAIDKIQRHLIECIVVWKDSTPEAHKAQFEITSPQGKKFLIDFIEVTEN